MTIIKVRFRNARAALLPTVHEVLRYEEETSLHGLTTRCRRALKGHHDADGNWSIADDADQLTCAQCASARRRADHYYTAGRYSGGGGI